MVCGLWPNTLSLASPPACFRNLVSLFHLADAVLETTVISSRRWNEGQSTIHLVAQYQVKKVFKGHVSTDDIVIVTDTCLDTPIPQEIVGYPGVKNYCLGMNLSLTGVQSSDGTPMSTPEKPNTWILFLNKDQRRGAPQQTWTEVSPTGFGGGCRMSENVLRPEYRRGFQHLLDHHPELHKSFGEPSHE